MYIITGDENIDKLKEKYIVLELDTIQVDDTNIPTYCVLDSNKVNFENLQSIKNSKDLHANLIKNYKKGDLKFCANAIKHLRGKFNGELDSFYDVLSERLVSLNETNLPENWNSIVTIS